MKKKEVLKLDKLNPDSELDFDSFNFDDIDAAMSSESKSSGRKPVTDTFKGVIGGMKDEFKNPAFLAGVVKGALPRTYGEAFSTADDVIQTASSLYDEAVREIKPQAARIAKKIDRLVPAEAKMLKNATTKLKNFVGDEATIASNNKKDIEDQSVANGLAAVFNAQTESAQNAEARSNAKSRVKDAIETNRFQSSIGLLGTINENVSRMTSYTEKVTLAYQKKSLELQFRSYFALSAISETLAKSQEIFKAQNDNIVKNTALPEYVKIRTSERLKEYTRDKFIGGAQNSLLGDNGLVRRGAKRLKQHGMAYIQGIREGMEAANSGLDAVQMASESMEGMEGFGMNKTTMAGQAAGGGIANWLGRIASDKLSPWMERNKHVMGLGYKMAGAAKNKSGFLKGLQSSDFIKNNRGQGGVKGFGADAADFLLSIFGSSESDMSMKKVDNLKELDGPAIFNNKTQTSITDIIPGYLSRIYREITMIRTGSDNAELMRYDYSSNKFVTSKQAKDVISLKLAEKVKASAMDRSLDRVVSTMGHENESDEQKAKIKTFYTDLARVNGLEYKADDIRNTDIFKALDKKTADTISKSLDDKLTNSKFEGEGTYKLSGAMEDVKGSVADVRGEIEAFIKAGYGDLLEEQGLIKYTKNSKGESGYDIDEEAYYGLVKSDINAKQGINLLKPRDALAALKKTKLYSWFYKQGKGDKQKHTGPMAQDVNANFGESSAPEGKNLDLVNLNGNLMSAIKAVDEKQDKLSTGKSDTIKDILAGIKEDTKSIFEFMQSGTSKGMKFGPLSIDTESIGNSISTGARKAGDWLKMFGGAAAGGLRGGAGLLGDMGRGILHGTSRLLHTGVDVYRKGIDSPVMTAVQMKAGEYFYKSTGKPVLTLADFKDPDSDIVNTQGEVVFVLNEVAEYTFGNDNTDFKKIISDAVFKLGSKAAKAGGTIFGGLGRGFTGLKNIGKSLYGYAKTLLNGPIDVYREGMDSPVLRANLMLLGYYKDSATDKVIETIEDLKNLKGDIVDKKGNVILSIEDMANGLYDKHGNQLKSLANRAIAFMKDKGNTAWGRLKGAFSWGKDKLSKGKDKAADAIRSGASHLPSVSIGSNDKVYNILVEIRDILKGDKGDSGTVETIEETPVEDNKELPEQPDSPKYKSGNVIDSLMSRGKSIKDSAADLLSKGKDKAKAGKAAAQGALAAGSAKALGWKGKLLAGVGSFFGSKDNEETKAEEQTIDSNNKPKKGNQPKGKTNARRTKKAIAKGKRAFNDKDGDGNRDGDGLDKLDDNKGKSANKEHIVAPIDLAPKYRSSENVVDTLMKKASGLIGLMTGGFGSLFGKTSTLVEGATGALAAKGLFGGLADKAKGIGKGALNVMKSPIKALGSLVGKGGIIRTVASGYFGAARTAAQVAMAVGAPALSAMGAAAMSVLTTIGSVLVSPIVIGAVAAAAVGYGLYKGYKYFTRDDVSELENIRMKQYGIGTSDSDKKFNHYILQLEDYLCEGKIAYNDGKASVIAKNIDAEEILSIFSIDKSDQENGGKFAKWFKLRFLPFFLTHLTALYSVDKKVKLSKIDSLKDEQKLAYLKLISNESGPYGYDDSPFKDLDSLNVDKTFTLAAITKLSNELSEKIGKATSKKNPNAAVAPKKMEAKPPVMTKPTEPIEVPKPDKAIEANKAANIIPPESLGEDGVKQKPTADANASVSITGSANLAVAGGGIKDGQNGMQYISLKKGVKLDGLHPAMLKNLMAMAQEYGEATGKSISINSGSRSSAEQKALYDKDPKKAARPGYSMHEFGLAVDIDSGKLDELESMGLMRKYGFTRPVGGEPWHTEPAGIQVNLGEAKNNSTFAGQAVAASLFKGGGGVGTLGNSQLGKRDMKYALNLMGVSAKEVKSDKDTAIAALSAKPSIETTGDVGKAKAVTITPTLAANDATNVSASFKQAETYSKTNSLPDTDSPVGETKPAEDNGGRKSNINTPDFIKGNGAGSTDIDGIKSKIIELAKKAGVDPNIMLTLAAVESSFNPNAKASTTGASGLFQVTGPTWGELIAKHAGKYGLSKTTSPTDITASTLLASEYVKSNTQQISSVKTNPSITDIYLTYFLGVAGAKKFLAADPNAIAAEVLPNAAKKNYNIFYEGGKALTIAEVYAKIKGKLKKAVIQYGIHTVVGGEFKSAAGSAVAQSSVPTPNTPSGAPAVTKPANEAVAAAAPKPAVTQGAFAPPAPTVISTNTAAEAKTSTGDPFGTMSSVLDKSLNVQKDMLDVLRDILKNVSSTGYKPGDNPLTKVGLDKTTAKGMPEVLKSVIDLSRKSA